MPHTLGGSDNSSSALTPDQVRERRLAHLDPRARGRGRGVGLHPVGHPPHNHVSPTSPVPTSGSPGGSAPVGGDYAVQIQQDSRAPGDGPQRVKVMVMKRRMSPAPGANRLPKPRRTSRSSRSPGRRPQDSTMPLQAPTTTTSTAGGPFAPQSVLRLQRPPCKFFLRSGSCKYGSNCKFAHVSLDELFGAMNGSEGGPPITRPLPRQKRRSSRNSNSAPNDDDGSSDNSDIGLLPPRGRPGQGLSRAPPPKAAGGGAGSAGSPKSSRPANADEEERMLALAIERSKAESAAPKPSLTATQFKRKMVQDPMEVYPVFPFHHHPGGGGSGLDDEEDDDFLTCQICLCDYSEGEQIMMLPCMHRFHAHCSSDWIKKGHPECPVCGFDIRTGGSGEF